MGKPKFPRKKYDTPLHPWKEDRIKTEHELIKKYGLKNHREIWRAKTVLRKYRRQARDLLAKISGNDPQVKKESEQLLLHLTRMSILPAGSTLDDVLALDTEAILSRRLQTLVYLKGLANTIRQARQLISHGHIAIGGRKVTVPGYMVTKDEENKIVYTANSPLNNAAHPARPSTDIYRTTTPAAAVAKKIVKKPSSQKPAEEEKKEGSKEKTELTEKKEESSEKQVETSSEKNEEKKEKIDDNKKPGKEEDPKT